MKDIIIDTAQRDFQHAKLPPGFIRQRLKYGDYLMSNTFGSIGIEEKKLDDLVRSWSSRRLQRQMRDLIQASDITCLALRDSPMPLLGIPQECWLDLVKLQTQGVIIVWLPKLEYEVLIALKDLRATLQPGRHLLSALAGSDTRRPPTNNTSLCARSLLRLFAGHRLPVSAAQQIASYYEENLLHCLADLDNYWSTVPKVGPVLLAKKSQILKGEA